MLLSEVSKSTARGEKAPYLGELQILQCRYCWNGNRIVRSERVTRIDAERGGLVLSKED